MPKPVHELRLRKDDIDSILRQARESHPLESCGLMVGRRRNGACVCDHIIPTDNVDRSPTSFTIAPQELLKGYRHADEVGMEIVGVYHSHPAPAAPSKTDLGFMKWSAPVWLIVSNLDWRFAAYRLDRGRPSSVRITVA